MNKMNKTAAAAAGAVPGAATQPLLQVKNLRKQYKQKENIVQAVDNVDITLHSGEILGVVGESGCGKSTLARCIIRLLDADEGSILWQGSDISRCSERQMRSLRPQIQMIFQNPYASFNPRFSLGHALEQVGKFYGLKPEEYQAKLTELLAYCEIDKELLERRPSQLSGGQLQRLAIVRALLPSPKLLIADEAVSALDVSIQESILVLLRDLRERYGIAVLFISHDLAVVKALCQRVVVMYRGRIVEEGGAQEVFGAPAHPYTQALLSARPRLGERRGGERILLTGDVSDISGCENGCLFANRCFAAQVGDCRKVRPVMKNVSETHRVSCHIK